ncbi:MAG: transporter substrate-binding domain-containing protein [Gammaproteobacteria bacterium]|nr:transporter substrate-binding domain-containing protein [Gammaproteobacteria bacterium]
MADESTFAVESELPLGGFSGSVSFETGNEGLPIAKTGLFFSRHHPPSVVAWVLCALMSIAGCGSPPQDTAAEDLFVGDLADIEVRGHIRFGRQTWAGFDSLPQEGLPMQSYYRLAEEFARMRGLSVRWVDIDDFVELLQAPAAGRVDVVINNVTVTESRRERLGFTIPLTLSDEWLIGRSEVQALALESEAFRQLKLGIPTGTAYLDSVATTPELAGLSLEHLPSTMLPDEVVDGITAGRYDLTLMDAGSARFLVANNVNVERLWTLPNRRQLAWVTRRDSADLSAALDQFLVEQHIGGRRAQQDRQDLIGIKASGTLRMLTLTGPHTFFLWRGELLGFEYELLKLFAAEQGVRLEVVLAPDRASLFEFLESDRADVLAAAVTVTEERLATGLYFSEPYMYVDEVFVSSASNPPPETFADLNGRIVYLNPVTSHWQHLQQLESPVEIRSVTDDAETLLQRVRNLDYDLTLIDSHMLAIERAYNGDLAEGLVLTEDAPIAWVVHPDNIELGRALDEFTKRMHRGRTYNLLWQKYFGNERRVSRHERQRIVGADLSPYDGLVKQRSSEFEFDWRMVVAQMYQESKFDPKQTSFAGARGLMQVMPRTAGQVGIDEADLWEPEPNIVAGVRYLNWTRERFEESLPLSERLWFALAAYNAGPGHVRDARRLARQQGLNPDLWFDNVERAMLLLSKPEYAQRAHYGFVRGSEPVKYVREIRERYRAYVDHLNELESASAP